VSSQTTTADRKI